MRVDKLRRRQRHPLIERHFGEVVAFEDFEKVEDAALAIPLDRSTFLVFYGAGGRDASGDAINAVLAAASACSTPAPRSNSRAVARGTARSAAPGPSMAAAIGFLAQKRSRGPSFNRGAGYFHR
jgi:hypothetical protein